MSTTEFYLRKQYIDKNRALQVFITGDPVLPYMLKMYKQKGLVIKNRFIHSILQKISVYPLFKNIVNKMELNGFYDWEVWNKAPAQLKLTEEEYKKGRKLLKGIGVKKGVDYVCIHARDNSYTDTLQKRDTYWKDNDFRDCSIENYEAAALYLADKGICVIRMGNSNSPPFKTDHPLIIDYATKYKSDFADVFLSATCKFFLGNTSAVYLLSSVFDVPVAYTNMTPIGESGRKKNDIYILKKIYDENTKQYIPFKGMQRFEDKFFSDQLHALEQSTYILNRNNSLLYSRLSRDQLEILKTNRITICENTPDEILWLTKEMNEKIDGVYKKPEDWDKIQKKHLAVFDQNHPFFLNPPVSPICFDFVKNNMSLWENDANTIRVDEYNER
ncbi:TIGR04372 family glycosyltransferase [Desulfobacterales bacterium HSG17]|nr:TIGR04372 family glycosyltransferase [Desulfobacterales bacterium HSG17]